MNPTREQIQERLVEARAERIRQVLAAQQQGAVVAYSLRTLLEDGHSIATIKAVTEPYIERKRGAA